MIANAANPGEAPAAKDKKVVITTANAPRTKINRRDTSVDTLCGSI